MKLAVANVFASGACLLIGCIALSSGGCSPSSVEAVPRQSAYQPVFGSGKKVVEVERSNDLDLGFLHDDLFACLTVDLPKLMSNQELAEIPWEALEERLAALIGPDNANLDNIQRAWFLIDRDSLSMESGGTTESPIVFVLDLNRIANEDQLIERSEVPATGDPSDAAIKLSIQSIDIKRIGENRIVVGNPSLTGKFSSTRIESRLSRQLKQMKLDSDVDGLIDILPIRSALQWLFDMAASLGGESVAKFSHLPEVTQRAEFSLSFSARDMFEANVYIDDDELTREIARMASEASNSNGSGGFGSLGMMPPGMGMGGMNSVAMIAPTSTQWLTEIGKQIAEENLYSVSGANRKVTFKLTRPDKVKQLMGATLHDLKQQSRLEARIKRLDTIANAMKSYQEKHGMLPPRGVIHQDAAGIPDQFNWRVGLLPFLGEQELYEGFDFEEPWDSRGNLEIANQLPKVFANNDDELDEKAMTRFHVVGGAIGLYENERGPKLDGISDKKIWTAVVIEGAPESSVFWTQPGSLEINDARLDQFGNENENGILFFNAAFDTRIITKDQEKVRGILTPDGGEPFQRRDFLPLTPGRWLLQR